MYVPTNEATDEDKESFEEQLHATFESVPKQNLVETSDLKVNKMKEVKMKWGNMEIIQWKTTANVLWDL